MCKRSGVLRFLSVSCLTRSHTFLSSPWARYAACYVTHQSSAQGGDTIRMTPGKHGLCWYLSFCHIAVFFSSLLFLLYIHLRQARFLVLFLFLSLAAALFALCASGKSNYGPSTQPHSEGRADAALDVKQPCDVRSGGDLGGWSVHLCCCGLGGSLSAGRWEASAGAESSCHDNL